MVERIDEIKRPLVIGEYLSVPCILFNKDRYNTDEKIGIAPIINHLHNDIENGQDLPHYHVDYRFIADKELKRDFINDFHFPKEKRYYFNSFIRFFPDQWENEFKIEYWVLPVIRTHQSLATHISLIDKSKFKHDCIYKGKCPHRGFDLSQTEAIDGVITCPLHSLKFDAHTKKIISDI